MLLIFAKLHPCRVEEKLGAKNAITVKSKVRLGT